jgi:hypothetical protein
LEADTIVRNGKLSELSIQAEVDRNAGWFGVFDSIIDCFLRNPKKVCRSGIIADEHRRWAFEFTRNATQRLGVPGEFVESGHEAIGFQFDR